MAKKRILVDDDEQGMLDLLESLLERNGYEVSTCDSGLTAWSAIIDNKPDLLILDVMLPGTDGVSLQKKISENEETKHMPVIVISALEPTRTMFRKYHQVKRFIMKPFKHEEITKAVEKAIDAGPDS